MRMLYSKKLARLILLVLATAMVAFIPALSAPENAQAATAQIKITPEYRQTEARSMLSKINSWRAGSNWYYNENNVKQYVSGLKALKYDYTLEKYAMQRAAEIALSFEHTRPTGTTRTGLSGYMGTGENIAATTSPLGASADYAMTMYKEEDKPYSGQGHRRIMLSVPANFDAVGFANVYYKGCYYWVQIFGITSSPDLKTTTAVNGNKAMTVELDTSRLTMKSADLTELNNWQAKLNKGQTDYLPDVNINLLFAESWPFSSTNPVNAEAVPTWTSSNTGVATINSSSNTITGVNAGSSSLTMKETITNTTKAKTVTVSDPNAVTGVSLNKTTLSLTTGASSTLAATVTPSNASNKSVTWSSSNTSVATVSSTGVVKGVKAGTATITVRTASGGKTATCKVTVNDIAVTGVTLNRQNLALNVGKTGTLTATVAPSNATNKAVNWSSSNTGVATVSSTGVVKGIKAGTATITARTASGAKTATCKIQVGDYYISNGSIVTSFTGLANVDGWKYYKNGVFDASYTGMAKSTSGKWYYVKNGIYDTSFTGFAKDTNGVWYHVKKGVHNTAYTGFTTAADGIFYYFVNGTQATSVTGIVESASGKRYYVTKGKYDTAFTGLAKFINDNKWYYVKNGVYTSWTGLCKSATGKWYYVKDGSYDTSYTGMTQAASGKWYYVTKGNYDTSYTGMAQAPSGKWYYINKGNYDTSYTGLAKALSGKLYYVTKGVYDTKYNGTAVFNGVTYTVKNGNAV